MQEGNLRRSSSRQPSAPSRYRKWACPLLSCRARHRGDGHRHLPGFAVRIPNLGTAFQSDGRFDANSPSLRGVFGSGDKSSSATTGIYIDDVPVTAALQPRVLTLNALRYCGDPRLTVRRPIHGRHHSPHYPATDLQEASGALHTAISSVSDGGTTLPSTVTSTSPDRTSSDALRRLFRNNLRYL